MDDNQKKTENKGYLFKNKRKNKQAQPDMTGKINWEGKELAIAAWEKTSSSGEKFLSLALSEVFKPAENAEGGAPGNTGTSGYNNPGAGNGYSTQKPVYEKKAQNSTASHPDNSLNELNDLFDE